MTELIVDSFAGGGGASLGIELALGRSPDIAINHDAEALAMHRANHPATLHLPHNVWKVDPVAVTEGRPVGLLWASPDCKHHSKAKGGKPVKRSIRDLAWVVVRWARQVRPRVIIVENVEEFRDWGPVDLDGMPCKERKGKTFEAWVADLRRLGYKVEWRELRACYTGFRDHVAPTMRKRLFIIARRDGRPIIWPAATHGEPAAEAVKSGSLKPWRTAADCIDWSLPCPSIFLTRDEGRVVGANRPLAENTMARIAKGVKRYVIDAAEPFLVPVTHQGDARAHATQEPLRTVTTAPRGEHALVTPFVTKFRQGATGHAIDEPLATVTANSFEVRPGGAAPLGLVAPYLVPRYGERPGQEPRTRSIEEPAPVVVPTANGGSLVAAALVKNNFGEKPCAGADEPLHTVTTQHNRFSLATAFLAQHNTDMVGHDAREPVSTIVGKGCTQAVVSAGLVNLKGSDRRACAVDGPAPTITAGGWHVAETRAFLIKYFGTDQDPQLGEPLHTVTTKDRFGLVQVEGELYSIVGIGMRMLTPRELFRAQGFPDSYRIDEGVGPDGERIKLTKTSQIRMCGNSVCPPVAAALVAANYSAADATLPARPRTRAPRPAPLLEAAE